MSGRHHDRESVGTRDGRHSNDQHHSDGRHSDRRDRHDRDKHSDRRRDEERREERDERDERDEREDRKEDSKKQKKSQFYDNEPKIELSTSTDLRRKTRWSDVDDKVNIPGLPTSLPRDLTAEQIENYLIHMRIEELGRTLRIGDFVPPIKRSVSPPPKYDSSGKRSNTREMRYRKKLEDERHCLVEDGMKNILGFRPPMDYKRPSKLQEKVYIPCNDFPEINFIGLLIGPRGNTLKKMENETGTKISIRGRGSIKDGKHRSQATQLQQGDDDDLHALISADTEERIKACIAMIHKIIQTATSVPEGQNELKRNQLRELAALNGTLRDDENQICANCGGVGHRRFECTESANFTSQLVCRICNSIGHLARDCLQKNDPVALQAANTRDQKLDTEYNTLMAELTGDSKQINPQPWVKADDAGGWLASVGVTGGSNAGLIQGYNPDVPLPFMPPPPAQNQGEGEAQGEGE